MKIRTETLQRAVTRALKGASLNRLLPLTSMISIKAKSGILELVTTDMTNYLYIRENVEPQDDFEIVIGIEKFSKLVSKLSGEFVSLELADEGLKVHTKSGDYTIEIPLDENGNPIKFTDKRFISSEHSEIKLATVKQILQTCKPALAITLEAPCYTNYYIDNSQILTTDSYKIACLNKAFFDETALISSETMNLLDVMQAETILYYSHEDEMMFESDDCSIYSVKANGLDEYASVAIRNIVDSEFDNSCRVVKDELIAAIDRVLLFVGVYDNKAVKLDFNEGKLRISNKASNAEEVVELIDGGDSFICLIDGEMLMSQLKANPFDEVVIQYGLSSSVKIVNDDSDITQVISLMKF